MIMKLKMKLKLQKKDKKENRKSKKNFKMLKVNMLKRATLLRMMTVILKKMITSL